MEPLTKYQRSYRKRAQNPEWVAANNNRQRKRYHERMQDPLKRARHNEQSRLAKRRMRGSAPKLAREKKLRRKYGRELRSRYGSYIANANTRKLPFALSLQEFKSITACPCHYCGRMPERGYSGIDREDNSKGYELSNCRSSCTDCNFSKRERTKQEFLSHAAVIAKRWHRVGMRPSGYSSE